MRHKRQMGAGSSDVQGDVVQEHNDAVERLDDLDDVEDRRQGDVQVRLWLQLERRR